MLVLNRAAMLDHESPLWTTYFLVTDVLFVALTVGVAVGSVEPLMTPGLHDDADEGDDGDEEDDRRGDAGHVSPWSWARLPVVAGPGESAGPTPSAARGGLGGGSS